jgi:hypothetical protein
MESTLRAIKKVNEIKTKRADMFYKIRMRAHKGTQRELIREDIKKGIELIAPAAAIKEKAFEKALRQTSVKQTVSEPKMRN